MDALPQIAPLTLSPKDQDFSKSQTSSYLDLSPLYGDTQEDQDTIRTFKDGLLKPDCFAEHRLRKSFFPPSVKMTIS